MPSGTLPWGPRSQPRGTTPCQGSGAIHQLTGQCWLRAASCQPRSSAAGVPKAGHGQAAAKSKRTVLARRGVFRARHSAEGNYSPWGMAHSPLMFPPHGVPRWARGAQSPARQEDGAQGTAHAPRGCPSQKPPRSQAGKFGTGMTQLTGDHLTGCPCIAWQDPLLPPSHPAPERHWLVMDLHSSHMRLPAPPPEAPPAQPQEQTSYLFGFFLPAGQPHGSSRGDPALLTSH